MLRLLIHAQKESDLQGKNNSQPFSSVSCLPTVNLWSSSTLIIASATYVILTLNY